MPMRKLTEQEQDWVLNDTFQSVKIDETLGKINMTRRQFNQYLKDDLEFAKKYAEAEIDACRFIENDMLNIHRRVAPENGKMRAIPIDHKLARVMMEGMKKILEYRNPSKYSPKMDVNMNSVVSIRDSLNKANERVQSLMRDATPVIEIKPTIKLPK